MKAKEVLELLKITREILSRVVKRGDIKAIKCPITNLENYCYANGFKVDKVFKDIVSWNKF